MSKLSRRSFLSHSAKTAVAAAALPIASSYAGAQTQNEYEFIIVGSGAGGGPLAVNLAKEGYSVLLIEAGGDKQPKSSEIPAYHVVASEDPAISWDFFVRHYDQNNKHAKWSGRGDKQGVLYPRASVVGGCTAHNALICLYPDHDDWNRIFELDGKLDPAWQAQNMRKLFLDRIENSQYFTDKAKGWHNLEMSPLSLLKGDSVLQKIVLIAAKQGQWGLLDEITKAFRNPHPLKLDSYLDSNSEGLIDSTGFMRVPKSTYLGARWGVYNYITEMKDYCRNLTVQSDTFVKKIIFDKASDGKLRAIGVEALVGKNLYSAHKLSPTAMVHEEKVFKATREVIVCGGAFNSPQLLMLSGIGPEDQYSRGGGPLTMEPLKILDGVGRNLQDRYEVTVATELDQDLAILKNCEFSQDYDHPEKDKCLQDWMNESTRSQSPYSTNGVVTWIKMRSSQSQDGKTDLILFGAPGDFRGYYPGYARDAVAHKNRFSWAILKGHSRNRAGRVTVNNANPLDTPNIHFHYFEGAGGDQDLQAVLEGVQRVRTLNRQTFGVNGDDGAATADFNSLSGKGEYYPGTQIAGEDSLKQWIQREAWGHHASCSNKMGWDERDGSVVNFDFKVHGTSNLRIVDASVFPEIPGLFIVTPIYMISEKASDVIIRQNGGSGRGTSPMCVGGVKTQQG